MVTKGFNTTRNALLGMTLLIAFANVVSTEPTIITAGPGQTVSLPCQAPDKDPVKVVEWDRTDLEPEHVLLYRNNRIDYEHPSYKNRVNLPEGWKTNGDVSLTLKNVTTNDSGTYECHVKTGTNKNIKVSSINLNVVPPGDKDGGDKDGGDNSGSLIALRVGLSVGVLLLLFAGFVGWRIYRRCQQHQDHPIPPPDVETELHEF